MAKKTTLADTATTLPTETLTPEAGDQGAAPEGTLPNAPETPAPVEDAPGVFIDDAGDASADDPLPGPAPTLEPLAWPVDIAPKDGRLLRLLVDYRGEESGGPLDDADQAWTIGFNNFADTDEDKWQIAGWNWSQDCFTEGHGKVVGWLHFHDATVPALGHDDMVEAYMAGAFGVHEEWLRAHAEGEAPPRGDPEFREAATNHADGYATRYIAHASRDQPMTVEQAVLTDRGLCMEERFTDTMLSPATAEQAIDWLNRLDCVDPEAAARISWPGLFSPADDPAPEEAPLSEALLRATLAEIEARNSDLSRAGLIEELKAIEGVSIEEGPGGACVISLHGVTASAAGGMPSVLRVWCQKARRAIMNGKAV